jgi:hypothetical protein
MTFQELIEVGEGALGDGLFTQSRFTSRQFGEALHESMQYFHSWDRYRTPLRRGAVAGQVLRELSKRGLVERAGPHPQRWWQVPTLSTPTVGAGSPAVHRQFP